MPTLPLVIPIVWPTKVIIHFGKPIYFDDSNMKSDILVKNVEIVKKEVKKLIDLGLSKRENLFD
ncbi:MAG: hypothetical protein R2728_09975 [Chitinophagales bacterium]